MFRTHSLLAALLLFAIPALVLADETHKGPPLRKPPSGSKGGGGGGGGGGNGGGGSSKSFSPGSRGGSSIQSNPGGPSFQGNPGGGNKGSSGPTLQGYRERTFKNDGGGISAPSQNQFPSQSQNQYRSNPAGNSQSGNWNKDGGNWNKDGNKSGYNNWNKEGNWNKDNIGNKGGYSNWNNNHWNDNHGNHNHNHNGWYYRPYYPYYSGWSVGFYLPLGFRYPYYDYGDNYYRDNYYYDGGAYSVPQPQELESAPPLPSAADLSMMDESQLRQLVLAGVRSFETDMSGTANGSGWVEYLGVSDLRRELERAGESVAKADDKSAEKAVARERLAEIAGRFDATANNQAYSSVAQRWGFQIVLLGLPEYLRPQTERNQRQFSMAVEEFDKTLAGIDAGPGWRKFLSVDDLERMRESQDFPTADQVQELKPILAQFDTVARDPRYRTVVGLSGFIPLHVSLMRTTGDIKSHLTPEKQEPKQEAEPKPAEKKPAAPLDPIPL